MKTKFLIILTSLITIPNLIFAKSFREFTKELYSGFAQDIITLLIAAAALFFIYNVLVFMWKSSQGDDNSGQKPNLFWSFIALLVIVSIWGIIKLVLNTFDVNKPNGNNIYQKYKNFDPKNIDNMNTGSFGVSNNNN